MKLEIFQKQKVLLTSKINYSKAEDTTNHVKQILCGLLPEYILGYGDHKDVIPYLNHTEKHS